jgi:ribitol-5-phosphate 2-dehydrogenase (NADP+) / D-ribitol-5-phosphate cytidylyltransferase
MKKTVAIFGASGGIGSATRQQFLDAGYTVIPVSRHLIDFAGANAESQIQEFLSLSTPDVVVNCVGKFSTNDEPAGPTMSINFNSNWAIVQHYLKNPQAVRIIMIGSSAGKAGKKDYMVYSASKAALLNLWQGAKDAFADTAVAIDLVNPVRTRTKMVAPFNDNLDYLEPEEIARWIINLDQSNDPGKCVDITFKDAK